MSTQDTYKKLGHLARLLHESLKEIEGECENATHDNNGNLVSNAQRRLEHIEQITSDAAQRVMDHAEDAKSKIKICINKTRSKETKEHLADVDKLLTDIIVAQEFQDITGQLLKKVFKTLSDVETQLIGTLIENSEALDGPSVPVINAENLKQDDVDNLLDSLGF